MAFGSSSGRSRYASFCHFHGHRIMRGTGGLSSADRRRASFLDCGGKRSATPLWFSAERSAVTAQAPSPLRSAGALHTAWWGERPREPEGFPMTPWPRLVRSLAPPKQLPPARREPRPTKAVASGSSGAWPHQGSRLAWTLAPPAKRLRQGGGGQKETPPTLHSSTLTMKTRQIPSPNPAKTPKTGFWPLFPGF